MSRPKTFNINNFMMIIKVSCHIDNLWCAHKIFLFKKFSLTVFGYARIYKLEKLTLLYMAVKIIYEYVKTSCINKDQIKLQI